MSSGQLEVPVDGGAGQGFPKALDGESYASLGSTVGARVVGRGKSMLRANNFEKGREHSVDELGPVV